MLRAGCWLWAPSIAIPQSGCHSFLPWQTTSGPACAGHGLGDSSWQADRLCAGTWSDIVQAHFADSWYRLLRDSCQDAESTGCACSRKAWSSLRAHPLGCLCPNLSQLPLFYYTNNLTLYHRVFLIWDRKGCIQMHDYKIHLWYHRTRSLMKKRGVESSV